MGLYVPSYRIHRAVGMGGDRLVAEVADQETEDRFGDSLREEHDQRFGSVIDDVHALPGAAELLRTLRERGLKVVLATSGPPEQTDRLLRLVEGSDRVDARTTSEEADRSKPAPDLVDIAIERAHGQTAAMVGDAVWDVKAAKARDRYSIGLLSGGFGEDELRGAGASAVFATPAELVEHLDDTEVGNPV
jgi:HAD superfamily hydrolase (TIGR01549 family)